MRKGLFILAVLLVNALQAQYRAIVYFKDKAPCLSFSLSKAAAERRAKMGLTFDSSDLPVKQEYLDQLQGSGLRVLRVSRWLNAALVEGDKVFEVNHEFVAAVEQVKKRKSLLSNVNALSQDSLFSDKNFVPHRAEQLYKAGYTGKNIHIAVFDGGFKGVDSVAGFQKLRDEGRIFFTKDVVGNTSVFQYSNHGTQVLSVMAGYVPDNFLGTAVDAKYSLFVTEDVATETQVEEFNWAVAAEMADSLGVDVINSSLGYTEFDNGISNYTQASLDGRTAISTQAAVLAARKGILVVNSAGNSRNNAWKKLGAPADADSILAVAAITADSSIAFFSSEGPSADGRIKPDISALGHRTALINDKGQLVSGNGTSFSSPLIAGLCASVWQAMPCLNAQDIRRLMLKVSDRYAAPDTNFGYGIPDMGKMLELISGYTQLEHFTLYPNPAKGELYLSSDVMMSSVSFELLNAIGQVKGSLTAEGEKLNRFDLSPLLTDLPAVGTYFLRIRSSVGTEVKALVIN